MNFFPQYAESPTHIESPPVEVPVAEVQSPVEEISVEPVVYDEPIYYEPEPTSEPEPQIESLEVQERGIPRKILEDRLPTEQADEYYRRMELNARAKEFEASLPDDMSADEKREATRKFRLRAKDALGLQ